jgi:hypothetical protein
MALVVVTSVRAAPGASTLAVLAAACWPRPVALLEADPSGGALAVRYRLGRTPGLAGLAAVVRHEAPTEALWAHAQMLPGDLPVVVAPESGEVTSGILRDAAGALALWCRSLEDVDVIVDIGRFGVQDVTWPLCANADEILIVARPRAEELYPVAHRYRAIAPDVRSLGLVLVGDRPHGPGEISTQLGVDVHGVVADDPRAAGVLTFGGSSRGLRRSPLVRSVRTFVDELVDRLDLVIPEPAALDAGTVAAGALPEGDNAWQQQQQQSSGGLPPGTAPFPPPPPLPNDQARPGPGQPGHSPHPPPYAERTGTPPGGNNPPPRHASMTGTGQYPAFPMPPGSEPGAEPERDTGGYQPPPPPPERRIPPRPGRGVPLRPRPPRVAPRPGGRQ